GPESSLEKVLGSETDQRLQDLALELFGPYGALREGESALAAGAVARQVLYARPAAITGGTTGVHRHVMPPRSLGLPRVVVGPDEEGRERIPGPASDAREHGRIPLDEADVVPVELVTAVGEHEDGGSSGEQRLDPGHHRPEQDRRRVPVLEIDRRSGRQAD